MSLSFKAIEMADQAGRRLGIFRLAVISSDRPEVAVPLCKCPGGHRTWVEAVECKKAAAVGRTLRAGGNLEALAS